MGDSVGWRALGRSNAVQDAPADDREAAGPPPQDPAVQARAARAAAAARHDAFVAGGLPDDECSKLDSGRSLDRCVKEDIPSAVLFAKQGDDVDAIDPKDVRQGSVGDCAFLACVAALAATPAGRALLRNAVVENKDGRGRVASFTVTLHERVPSSQGPAQFREVRVTVAGAYVVGHASARAGDHGEAEVWPAVFEKAYAQLRGGYDKVSKGEVPADALATLTGRETTYVRFGWLARLFPSYGGDDLRKDLAAGKVVVFSTPHGLGANTLGLRASHAYFAIGVQERNGKLSVRLGNPWGSEERKSVPCDELSAWFTGVSVGSVPGCP